MAIASPFLNTLLDHWTARRASHRRDASSRRDELSSVLQELDERRNGNHSRRQHELNELEALEAAGESRWTERLRRLEEWKTTTHSLGQEANRVFTIVTQWRWLDRAREISNIFCERLTRRTERLRTERLAFHEELGRWPEMLRIGEERLKVFQDRANERDRLLLVSRARKKPEQDFADEQFSRDKAFERDVQKLRRSATLALSRIYKGLMLIEKRAHVFPALFNEVQQQIQAALEPPKSELLALRGSILEDALVFESQRRRLRGIQQWVKDMRCIEDVYRAPEPRWKRIWRRLALAPSSRTN